MEKSRQATQSIMKNEQVKELLSILQEQRSPSMQDFQTLLKQVESMEKQLTVAVNELINMRQWLATLQPPNHSARPVMQKALLVLQNHVLELRGKLAELRSSFLDGCRSAIAHFKQQGIVALDHIARFFKIHPMLNAMREDLGKSIQYHDQAIAKIETISTEYHKAGQHLKNISRVMRSQDATAQAKPMGNIAKAFISSYRRERNGLAHIKKGVESALNALSRLENRAKPSIQQTLETHKKLVIAEKSKAPMIKRAYLANAER